jgi:hypothetical protein
MTKLERTALLPRAAPALTAEEESFLSAISAAENAHIFSLEAVSKAYANTTRLRPDMTDLEREHLALLIANDLTALLTRELPEQSDALLALVTEIESASITWVSAWAKGAK